MTADKTKSTAQTLIDSGKDVLSQTASQATETAKSVVSDASSALREGAERRAAAGMDALSDQGTRLGESLQEAAAKQEGTLQGQIMNTFAGSILDTAEKIRGQDLQSILGQADDFARRNPGAFVASAALLGFAAVRFAKSSGQGNKSMPDDMQSGTGDSGSENTMGIGS